MNTSSRIEGFDLLRGLCAIAVALYHMLYWSESAQLNAWGRYGVNIFFVLSGASVFYAYSRKFEQGYSAAKFIGLRFARLAPLFVLVMSYTMWANSSFNLRTALLNVSLMFGVGMPGNVSAVTGGWSLGIEFLFYLTFPVLAAVVSGRAWISALVGSFILQHTYLRTAILHSDDAANIWPFYAQMLSFIFYFVAGCCIGRLIQNGVIKQSLWWYSPFFLAMIPLSTLHSDKNLTGITGIALSLCAVTIALASSGIPMNGLERHVSRWAGQASYGVYLLHPLIYFQLADKGIGTAGLVAIVLCLSAGIAMLAERYIERPVQAMARRMLV